MLLAARTSPASASCARRSGRPRARRARAAVAGARARASRRLRSTRQGGRLRGTLSGGQRKLLELGAGAHGRTAAAPARRAARRREPHARHRARPHRAASRERGATFLFVEHDMDVVMRRSDAVVVMARGSRPRASGHPMRCGATSGSSRRISAPRSPTTPAAPTERQSRERRSRRRGRAGRVLRRRPHPARRRADVAPGEIVTIVGPNGAGKSTLVQASSSGC